MSSNFRKLADKLRIDHGADALVAALFSLAAAGLSLWGLSGILYGKWPVYEELVAGGNVWDGYNKQGDMTLFYLLYLLIPLYFCLFLYVKHTVMKSYKTNQVDKGSISKESWEAWKIRGLYPAAAFLGVEAVRAVETAAAGMWPGHQNKLSLIGQAAAAVLVVGILGLALWQRIKHKESRKTAEWFLMIFQLVLPFQFLGYYRFFYEYESEEGLIQLFYSAKWKWSCLVLLGIFLFCQIRGVWKRKKGIYLTTLMLLAIGRVAATPEGILSVDFFHNGEMAFPMQQLLSYGKIPYFDLDPIHGLCDYFYSLVNVIFFDGSYFCQNVAVMAAGMIMAALLAAIMGRCINNRYLSLVLIYLVMPYLVQKAGVRYLLFFGAFFILFCDRVRGDSRRFLWWWILLCIAGISWNVSIGSSMAVAFLPEILYRIVRDILPKLKSWKNWDKRERKRFLTAYGILFVIGICYIPWFLQILRFLSENAGTTLYVNGTPVFGDEFQPVRTFGFLLPYIVALTYALAGSKKGKSAFVSMFTCFLVISNYACVRYDEGARLAVLAVFFMVLYAGNLLADKKITKSIQVGAGILCMGLTIWLVRGYLPHMGQSMAVQKIPSVGTVKIMDEEIEDPIVFVSGESVDMPNLGTGFIQGSTFNSLKNVQTVVNTEALGESYLDLTNKISHYVILDKESVLPFTSAYNISNEKMQKKAISLIEAERPRLILISPLIRFDLAPLSLRSMKLYTTLVEMGYEPYVYEDVVYLLDKEPNLLEAAEGRRALGLICHKDYMGMLPYIWGASMKADAEDMGLQSVDVDYELVPAAGEESREFQIHMREDRSGMEISYIAVSVPAGKADEQWSFSFKSDVDGQDHRFSLLSGAAEDKVSEKGDIVYLIPVGSSPFWQYSRITGFEVSGVSEIRDIRFYH
ncbi:MAG: oligosaccharide repeat unit polymerase [Lachnospiraceae bacterium]|nr:oligosaccharide repeat unit polymerase [Lachnospiraceae bacterium]